MEILTDEIINKISKLYTKLDIVDRHIIDSSKDKNDKRFAIIFNYIDNTKMLIKLTNNCFTNGERVEAWAKLIENIIV